MKTKLINALIITLAGLLGSCSGNNSNCYTPNANVSFESLGNTYTGIGVFETGGYGSNYYRVFGVFGGCDPNSPMDTMLRITIPRFIPDTPYTYQLTNYNPINGNNGFMHPDSTANVTGQFTIASITSDSLASGTFYCSGIAPGGINYSYSISNGSFSNVKLRY